MRNFKIFTFLMLFFIPLLSFAQTDPGDALWAKSVVSAISKSWFETVIADSNNNIYAVGGLSGSNNFDFGNGVTVSGGYSAGSNPLIIKYNSSGTPQWAKSSTAAPDYSAFNGVAIDSNNNVYAAGYIYGTTNYDFGNGVTVKGTNSTGNVVLVKYNSNGDAEWAKSVTSSSSGSIFHALAIDDSGNIYAAGYIDSGSYDFGDSVPVSGTSSENIVLVKYNSSGVTQWARSVTSGSERSEFTSLAIDSNNNIFAAGFIGDNSTYGFGNGVTVSSGPSGKNIVLVKYNSNGEAHWAKSVTTAPSISSFNAVTVDGSGNVFAGGYIYGNGTYNFGVNTSGTSKDNNLVLVKYDNSGNAQWARSVAGGSNTSIFKGVTADQNGNIYAVGSIYGNATYSLGDGIIVSGTYDNGNNLLFTQYDNNGNIQFAKSIASGPDSSSLKSVAVSKGNNVYAIGNIHGNSTFDLGNETTVNAGSTNDNPVLVKYLGDPPLESTASSIVHKRWPLLLNVGGMIMMLL